MSHNPSNPALANKMAEYFTPSKPWTQWNPLEWSVVMDTDSYKVSMSKQYPPKTEIIYSYIEARGGRFPNTVWFGLQAFLKKLERPITAAEVEFANAVWTAHGEPFPYDGWMYIVNELDGKLPIQIDAVEEGTVVPTKNALLRIYNTDPNCYWLTTWIETPLLRAVWYPTTVATLSWSIKQLITKYLKKTTDDDVIPMVLPFRLHDFGSRGVSSHESAMLGGMAHLVNFMGTDTGASLMGAMAFYGAEIDPTKEAIPGTGIMTSPGYSIPAAEHSTITSWGRDGEAAAFENMLTQFGGPGKLVAVVSDSYDFFEAVKTWGTTLKDKVEQMGGTLVVRPDSGDPTVVPVEGIKLLGEYFGYTVNSKGYKVLPNCVKLIQGDGIDMDTIEIILSNLEAKGWSAENIAFGMGGALLHQPNRDTMKWAMKCSAAKIDGIWHDVYKDPVTDAGKRSKKGQLGLEIMHGLGSISYRTLDPKYIHQEDLLKPVFVNGTIVKTTTFEEVRERSNNWGLEIHNVFATAA